MPPNLDNNSELGPLSASPPASTRASPPPAARSRWSAKARGVDQSRFDFAHPFARMDARALLNQQVDVRDWVTALAAGIGFTLIGSLCLGLSRFDATLASVWLPNAFAMAVLFLAGLRNELPFFLAIAAASCTANLVMGTPWSMAIVFTCGNLACIYLVTWLTRRQCGTVPDLSQLRHLAKFLKNGGIVGPLAGALIAAPIMGPDLDAVMSGGIAWFLAEAMGSILVVPVVLLVAQSLRQKERMVRVGLFEASMVASVGLIIAFLFLTQQIYPLVFLIPPVTLLVALRADALGTALFVAGLALMVCIITYSGLGPFASDNVSEIAQTNLIQAFVAANFLTGPPIAAILANRQQINEELAKRQKEVELLTDGITDAVLTVSMEGVCTYASPSVRTVLDRTPENLVGKLINHRIHEDAYSSISQALNNIISDKSDHERFTYRRLKDDSDGRPVFIEADCAVVFNEDTGERSRIIVAARDVTERVELEHQLTRSRRAAENAAKAKSNFLANMSHEIRTPMNGVLGFAELLLEEELSGASRHHAEMIIQSGRSMMMLLNDILDLSKIEAGQVCIAKEPVDLLATISECAALYRPTAEKKGLKLDFSATGAAASLSKEGFSCGVEPWIETDGLRLRQIVLNLLGNAVKFTEEGQVHIAVSGDASQITICVIDTGIGINEARVKTVFAPFTQGESNTARRFGGTGLGLTISRQLAELLNGTIEVESEPGVGSCFKLTLPATYTEAPIPVFDDEVDDEVDGEGEFEPLLLPQRASILLVEDHDVNRMLVTEMLERCGQSVATAHDGNEGIAMVIDSIMRGKPYDLVLMDIQMPGCDGYAATRAIRTEGITPDELPIIALTANAFPEDLAAARDAGMQAHLAKPLVFADLARTLQRWLPTRIIADGEEDAAPSSASPVPGDATGKETDHKGQADEDDDHLATQIIDVSRDPASRPPKIGEAPAPRPTTADGATGYGPDVASAPRSPAILRRWESRRREAVEAVREALESGALGKEDGSQQVCDTLATIVHKLAGTAALFGEAELGDQAAALEQALRMKLPTDVRETLAFELLSVADDPADCVAQLEE